MPPSKTKDRSSSSSSSSASATSTSDPSHSNRTIGYAVGFGVGIPILLTICILIWVTVRHRKKQREEDEVDKDIDFNGDVSFWSPQMQDAGFGRLNGFNAEPNAGVMRRDTMTTTHTMPTADGDSLANMSELDAQSQKEAGAQSLSHLYTPELGFTPQGSQENFSRAINSVYGPSPAYPSTDRLRMASAGSLHSGRFGHYHSNSFNSGTQSAGPFATPPRNSGTTAMSDEVFPPAPSFGNSTHPYASHYRGDSNSSSESRPQCSSDDLDSTKKGARVRANSVNEASGSTSADSEVDVPVPPTHNSQLTGLRESPHPYSNLVGTVSAQSIHTASSRLVDPNTVNEAEYDNEEDITDPASPLRGTEPSQVRHVYHQQARDRTSTFQF